MPDPSVLKLMPFLVPWSPALSYVSSSVQVVPPALSGIVSSSEQVGSLALTDIVSSATQEVPLVLTGIGGETGRRLALGPLFLRQSQSAWFPAPSVVKLRLFLAPLAPALSWDGDPGERLVLGPRAPDQYPSARCSAPSALKLGPFLATWCPALSCVSFSTQVVPLALTDIDGETGGRLALDVLFLGQWPLAWCPVPDALKLRSFLAPWSPALSCVSFSAQVGSMALSSIDGEPGRRVVLGPNRPQASVRQPGAHPPGALKLRPSLAPWSPALSCVNFSSQTGPLALTGIGFIGKQAQGCPVSATSQYFTWISSHVPWRMSRCELACPTYFPTWRSFWTHVLQLSPRW
ncbi:uncharacterized protein LOC117070978 isoform X1 [Trachypithecus francoisi]|uniref:uncharacterized protein LOC117070978 isoform X1 n=1 Tax=Trachypithecus francoisi TaxID=54180 RepID=UPI00141BB5A0|nr:uncharacterized protein LOC117070978 isoform X1 [Trachypithecus francoisi]XP_033046663.1 uncharacterized protein LOC117070978 isoform X1 [Trachypithecus francoisi]XP_033046664.1 uncharacterized protein LOC117070978 isoform X1 [Trachypithecus francoisi]XP_033046665.1 uncharacterized protein LOC117070978 isoform X1 [Trachypithecus francoisi]XP_033046666.1 uncharacterized protein LOC117070978 isoform X1 [Trachypithecus francoisi]XP_033046667.1 uncharacterized protein LOC117070978 isoform X1 [T